MPRRLTDESSLESFKKQAKRWLAALRAGDAAARARLLAATPRAPDAPGLRDVQLALAREHGFAGWTELKRALEDRALARRARRDVADEMLRNGVFVGSPRAAERLLARRPDVADLDLYTAAAAGRLERVRAILAADPEAAPRKGGPLGWEPLLYLAYMRLPGAEAHAAEIARLLLDHGADPDARWSDGRRNMASDHPAPPFTAITGLIGLGEGGLSGDRHQRPHPCAEALVALLLDRGADPLDHQALYNTAIVGDDVRWLDVLWAASERRGETDRWRVPHVPPQGGSEPRSMLDYLLGLVVAYAHPKRAEWLLAHGADVEGPGAASGLSLRETALVSGDAAMAELLARFGARTRPLADPVAFEIAVMRLDRAEAEAIAARAPEVLARPGVLLEAARMGRADVVSLLLDLGMDVDLMDESGARPIQSAIRGGDRSLAAVRLLVARGAEVDQPRAPSPGPQAIWYGGAMGFAAHYGAREIARYLAPLSRDVWNMAFLALKDRVAELLAQSPALASAPHPRRGATPLHALPDDADEAADMAALLLAHGADPTVRDADGLTPEERARKRGLYDAADVIAAGSAPTREK